MDNDNSADTVRVVRCKDCAFIDTLECRLNYIDKQRLIFTSRAPDWFCADGRLKGWEDKK